MYLRIHHFQPSRASPSLRRLPRFHQSDYLNTPLPRLRSSFHSPSPAFPTGWNPARPCAARHQQTSPLLCDIKGISSPMTATQVIAEIESLPPQEREAVFVRVHELEQEMIPDSFLQGMQEAMRGELIDMEDAHFITPPLAA